MGLLGELVLLPLAPVRAVGWTARQVLDAAQEEQRSRIRRELSELEQALLAGEITEEAFDEREDELLDLLDDVERGATA